MATHRSELCGLAFLAIQLAVIIHARFVPERFFCWAPFDTCCVFSTRVRLPDRELSPAEAASRYRYPAAGLEPRSIHNCFAVIRRYETTYGQADRAEVAVNYRVNGGPEQTWRWPAP